MPPPIHARFAHAPDEGTVLVPYVLVHCERLIKFLALETWADSRVQVYFPNRVIRQLSYFML